MASRTHECLICGGLFEASHDLGVCSRCHAAPPQDSQPRPDRVTDDEEFSSSWELYERAYE